MRSNYEKYPVVQVSSSNTPVSVGWDSIASRVAEQAAGEAVVCVECYPGALEREIEQALASRVKFDAVIRAGEAYKPSSELVARFESELTDDPVFGRMGNYEVSEFFDPARMRAARERASTASGRTLVIGTGAALIAPEADVLIYADMARWEIQLRQRRNEIANLGLENFNERPALKYKRAFFIDW
ncbi:MAG TPA: mannose-6-phosphate isomerase, partial [Clostridia bacterium]|nr:mannose-6-phosphate isomerase [Clostridia bacterium]